MDKLEELEQWLLKKEMEIYELANSERARSNETAKNYELGKHILIGVIISKVRELKNRKILLVGGEIDCSLLTVMPKS